MAPSQDASEHQDYYIFRRGSLTKPSFPTGILGGGHTQTIILYIPYTINNQGPFFHCSSDAKIHRLTSLSAYGRVGGPGLHGRRSQSTPSAVRPRPWIFPQLAHGFLSFICIYIYYVQMHFPTVDTLKRYTQNWFPSLLLQTSDIEEHDDMANVQKPWKFGKKRLVSRGLPLLHNLWCLEVSYRFKA